MKLVMIMCVRDEADIIRQNILFHLDHGVDRVIVLDNGSVDGTRDILSDLERDLPVHVSDDHYRDHSQGTRMSRLAANARDDHGADWILPNDADEFWLPHTGDLRASIMADAGPDTDMLDCVRLNLFAGWDAPTLKPWHERLVYRVALPDPVPRLSDINVDPRPSPHFYCDLPGKALLRAPGLMEVFQGNHGALYRGKTIRGQSAICVYHFPVRSRAQFETKSCNGGAGYARNKDLKPGVGWHKRRWYWQYLNQGLDAALADAVPSTAQLERDLQSGDVVEDTTIQRLMGRYTS